MSTDISQLLDDAAVARLRAAYAPDFMLASGRNSVAAAFPPAAGYVHWVIDHLYDPAVMPPKERERCLVALLAQSDPGSFTLAIHVYWGMMEGLSASDVLTTLALVGAYGGMQRYATGQATTRRTLTTLAKLVATPDARLDPSSIVLALVGEFQ
ncbi:MAG: hypothetical protein U0324_30775 [Polyangiales bacterium]